MMERIQFIIVLDVDIEKLGVKNNKKSGEGFKKMLTKLLGVVVFLDGTANMIWFSYHDKTQKHHRKYQFGRLIRVLIGVILVLV